MTDTPMLTYAGLAARLSRATANLRVIEPLPRLADDPEPTPSQCHQNAKAYAERHAGYRVVRGWLVSGGVFDAHSIVELSDGRLVDPTPLAIRPPFLRHPGPDSEFDAILEQSWNQIIAVSEGEHLPAPPDSPWPGSERLF